MEFIEGDEYMPLNVAEFTILYLSDNFLLQGADGILVPGGFGYRGAGGKNDAL